MFPWTWYMYYIACLKSPGDGTDIPPRYDKRPSCMLKLSINMVKVFLYMVQFSIDIV
jgi:hypothetical protein